MSSLDYGARNTQGRTRLVRLSSVTPALPPSDINGGQDLFCTGLFATSAFIHMSPRTPEGLRSTGFAFSLQPTGTNGGVVQAVATAPGFIIDIYRHQPETSQWSHFKQYTSANYGDLIITADINGGYIYFQITNITTSGFALLTFQEQ